MQIAKKSSIEELVQFNKDLQSGKFKIAPGEDGMFSIAASDEDVARQGDLYFVYVNEVPEGYIKVDPFVKMVPGETKGAKHCFTKLPLECYVPPNWSDKEGYDELLGPIVKIDLNSSLNHGEHGNILFERPMIEFRYQKDLDVENQKIKRQID